MVKYIFIYFEMNQNKLKIINSNEDDIKQFKSVDEFNLFYRTNKEMMDTKTTQWLNKNYSIITDNGDIYRITKLNTRDNEGRRQQGEICLKKVKNKNDRGSFESSKINKMDKVLTQVVNIINGSS